MSAQSRIRDKARTAIRKEVGAAHEAHMKSIAAHLASSAGGIGRKPPRAIRRAKRKAAKTLLKWNGHSHGQPPPMRRADGTVR